MKDGRINKLGLEGDRRQCDPKWEVRRAQNC